jgi:hypothetical protein
MATGEFVATMAVATDFVFKREFLTRSLLMSFLIFIFRGVIVGSVRSAVCTGADTSWDVLGTTANSTVFLSFFGSSLLSAGARRFVPVLGGGFGTSKMIGTAFGIKRFHL